MNRKNKIKVLVIESTTFGYDGITNVIVNYYKYQDHNRIQMDLVTINEISSNFDSVLKQYHSQNYILPYRNSNPIEYVINLTNIIKRGKYQIVHVHGCSATMAVEMLAAKLAGVKIRIAHSHNTKCDHIRIDKMLRPFFSKFCNIGFACSKEAGEWLFPNKDFSIITNGIDLEKYQFNNAVRDDMRIRNNLKDTFVIGHIGRFSKQKNHDKLVDIFSEISKDIPNTKLVLIGDGELREEVQERVQKQKLNVLFVGLSDEVEKWLQAMDIVIFPSLFEGIPLGLVEAQAAGLPCVLSDTISSDIAITDLVEFVKLDASARKWADVARSFQNRYDRYERNEYVKQQIREAHFDIKANCEELKIRYENLADIRGGKK